MKKLFLSSATLFILLCAIIANQIYMKNLTDRMVSQISPETLNEYEITLDTHRQYLGAVCQKDHLDNLDKCLAKAQSEVNHANLNELIICTKKLASYEKITLENLL